jgi:glycosyltransferase involved in cell wall biosynthesis
MSGMNPITRPLRVHVLVDLLRGAGAGGHVKVWERMADEATRMGDALDLTVHFSGTEPQTHILGERVRYRVHPPVFSSSRLPFLSHIPDHSDLGRHHRGLAEALAGAEVLHTTDAFFAFARTAERIARRDRVPLVTSVHSDTPAYTALYTATTLERVLGAKVARLLDGVPRTARARMEQRLLAHQRQCAYVLVSRAGERERLRSALPETNVGVIRRGMDLERFSPARRDRPWLETTFAIPPGRLVVLLVGRIDPGKNIGVVVSAVRALLDQGLPLHLLCAGDGPDRAAVMERLHGAVSCPGVLDRPRVRD